MIAVCNGTDLSDLIGHGYAIDYEPQYADSITALDGTDYSAKLRDRVHLTVPFIALRLDQLQSVLALFSGRSAYVSWTFFDPFTGVERTEQMKYSTLKSTLKVHYHNGVEYWDGLTVELLEK